MKRKYKPFASILAKIFHRAEAAGAKRNWERTHGNGDGGMRELQADAACETSGMIRIVVAWERGRSRDHGHTKKVTDQRELFLRAVGVGAQRNKNRTDTGISRSSSSAHGSFLETRIQKGDPPSGT